jgi:hypothetical protein
MKTDREKEGWHIEVGKDARDHYAKKIQEFVDDSKIYELVEYKGKGRKK